MKRINGDTKISISIYDIYALLIILFPIFNLVGGAFSYYDEIIGTISFVYIWALALSGKMEYRCQNILILMTVITGIGLLSNLVSGLISKPFPVIIDALWLWKTFATFIAFANLLKKDHIRKRVIKTLTFPAKFTIIMLFVLCIVGQFVNINVTGSGTVLGLKTFGFFWNNGISTGWLGFCALMIIALSNTKKEHFFGYCVLLFVPLILTKSSMVYCFVLSVIVLSFIYRKSSKFKAWYLIPISAIVIAFTREDIQEYFFTDSSVRKELIVKGAEVANMYFPFGSGFATYGSDMAQRYYSKLYDMFGWRDSWAFGVDSEFLNDNFFASIIGQFGWVGFALYLYALYKLFKMVNSKLVDKRIKITAVSTVLTIFVVMIGSASAKSMMGICTFAVLGMVYAEIMSKTPNLQKSKKSK